MAATKKVLVSLLIIVLAVLVVVLDARRREVEQRLQQLSVRLEQVQAGTRQNVEVARQVVAKVKRHIAIPEDTEPTVATIINAEALKKANSFYEPAENGDHLIVTPHRAILYDPDRDVILDVVPVQIQSRQAATPPPSDAPAAEEGTTAPESEGAQAPSG